MSILDWIGFKRPEEGPSDPETVRRIAAELESLDPERARFVGSFAYALGRVANADHQMTVEETEEMERLVREIGALPPAQAALAVEIAKSQNRLFGGTESFPVTKTLRDVTTVDERERVLRCLFAVAAADGEISSVEEAQVRQIASELDLPRARFVAIRSAFADHRSVLKGLRRPEGS